MSSLSLIWLVGFWPTLRRGRFGRSVGIIIIGQPAWALQISTGYRADAAHPETGSSAIKHGASTLAGGEDDALGNSDFE